MHECATPGSEFRRAEIRRSVTDEHCHGATQRLAEGRLRFRSPDSRGALKLSRQMYMLQLMDHSLYSNIFLYPQ
jgi:hypothetical protein